MDKETRNHIQRATQAARALLEHEYAERLEGLFDIRLDGTIAAKPGEHLDAAQRVLRTKLVTAVEHQRAVGKTKADAVASYLREAAFTTLNRFVALKMLEARELVQECISRGDQSAGFREFSGLAPGLSQLPDGGYRLYIESLFDEIGREVRVLFDCRDPASLLWPRRQALLHLLGILNASDLALVWGEDETIGWVYQYFNGEDERRKLREESQAPRNGRELAVRNQFFTPRFVVEFLVDNTLGRSWFEMMRSETRLTGLDYLVRRPHEVFLDDGEEVPREPEGVNFGEAPEHPFPVLFRAKKDPRDLKILDPACGSGHFLLYTFDLLLAIYQEAWQDEGAAPNANSGTSLRVDYPDLDALRAAAPELILRHNIHGIDIDPRAAQIAAVGLWLRAQRAFQEAELSRTQRPAITKTNIVVAEPMPGEADLRGAFVAGLERKLGKLVERVFSHMSLAGEAGYLLRIAEQIEESIRQIYGEYGALFRAQEESEWTQAARDLRAALEAFATCAAADQAFTRQLFAGDAARGLGFIDICSRRYDTILMNPPFGDCPKAILEIVASVAPGKTKNLYAAFVARAMDLLSDGGALGVISSRTFVTYTEFAGFRESLLADSSLGCLADLGWGVLDGAQVETAAYVVRRNPPCLFQVGPFIRLLDVTPDEKHQALQEMVGASNQDSSRLFHRTTRDFDQLPGKPLCYWASPSFLEYAGKAPRLFPDRAYVGLGASPHAFYFRAWWEVPEDGIGSSWARMCRGGDFSPYYRANRLVIRWAKKGSEVKAHILHKYPYLDGNYGWKIQDENKYFAVGLSWGKRNERFNVQFMPRGHVFTDEGQGIVPHEKDDLCVLLAVLNSALVAYYLSLTSGLQKHYVYVRQVPIPPCEGVARAALETAVVKILGIKASWARMSEADPLFVSPLPNVFALREKTLRELAAQLIKSWQSGKRQLADQRGAIDAIVFDLAGIEESDAQDALDYRNEFPADVPDDGSFVPEQVAAVKNLARSLVSFALGHAFGRWSSHAMRSTPIEMDVLACLTPGHCSRRAQGQQATAVFLDDPGHSLDLLSAIELVFRDVCEGAAEARLQEVGDVFDGAGLRQWLRKSFFEEHINMYSATRRKAPIYWQLATPSASYSAWLYYHRFTRDTLFRLLNDQVAPKLRYEERKLTDLTQDAGPSPTASKRKEIDAQETFVSELRAFRGEVARVAPLWNPNLDDGVILNFAPLWRLVPQNRSWQNKCKSAWDTLCKGDYDWAHLAMHLWPERVVPKCAKDRSLAIAHGLEEVFWHEDADGKWQSRRVDQAEIGNLANNRISTAIKDALKSLLEAPAPATGRAAGKKVARAKGSRKNTAFSRPTAAMSGPSLSSRSAASVDSELLRKVKEAIGSNGDGASKADVIDATGVTTSESNKAIKSLLADGSIIQTGERRGARYHLVGGDA